MNVTETVAAWLDELGLGQYASVFAENAVDISVLPDLNEVDLEKLGVALGHRKRMLRAIAALPAAVPPAPVSGTRAQVASPSSEGERRQLTVLFCDLVGSTALAGKLDPEDLSAIIRKFEATCVTVIKEAGGYVARFMGDGVLAYFGYPQAHEDDAERAVRAGLDLTARVGQLFLPSGEPLKARVGIATGPVIVGETIGEGISREQAVIGETPNLAARLQSLASPNTVLVSTGTRRLLGKMFVIEDAGLLNIKGMSEPKPAWRVSGEQVIESRFHAIHSEKNTSFVGRQHELQRMLGLWTEAKGGKSQVGLLCGEPGIGKSRIVKTLQDCIAQEPHIVIRYQCSPHHSNSPLYPVIRQLEHAARIERTDTADAKLEKLAALLSLAGKETQADLPLFADLLSIETGNSDLQLTPRQQKDLTIDALTRQLFNLARMQPVLVILEDVHWIDPTTLDLINQGIRSTKAAPVLFLITFRPEFSPSWIEQSNATMFQLHRLGLEQAGAIILDVTGGKILPPEVLEQILNKTDGIPLFVEELTKMVLEAGLLRDEGDRYIVVGTLPPLAIPTTLHDSLMARLDKLASIKEIAQIGAALGREFSYRLLAAVAPLGDVELQGALAQLTAAELIFARGEPPDSNYVFKHALLQDAAYESLRRGKRQQLHSRIADVLAEQFADMVETQPELMAHHLAQAGFTERAIGYLQKAGQRAIQRSANAEAIGHLKRAHDLVQLLAPSPQHNHLALALEVMLGQAMIAGHGYAASETKEVLLRAKALIENTTDHTLKFAVLYGLWACYYVGGEVDKQREAALEFVAEAERLGDTAAICVSHRTLGTTYLTMGEFTAARQHLGQARDLYDPENHLNFRYQYGQDIGAAALCYLCWALWHLGFIDQAAAVATEAVKHAEAASHPHTLAYTICHARGMMDVFRRRSEDTRSYAGLVVSICTAHGMPFWAAGGAILDGWAATREISTGDEIEVLRAGLAAWRKTGARLWLPMYLALEAEAHANARRHDAALHAINEAIAISDETGERWAIAEVLRIKAGLLFTAGRARPDEIETLLIKSLEIAQQQKALCWELRTACDLARLWQSQGRTDEALTLLRSSYDKFSEGFDFADLQEARALIESLRSGYAIDNRMQDASALNERQV